MKEKKAKSEQKQTVYIIRPEGRAYRLSIRNNIQYKTGLVISVSADVRITKQAIEKFFPNLPWNMREMAELLLAGKRCELGIVKGEDAIHKLRKICGVSSNPNECAPGTVRREFGPRMPIKAGKDFYWRDVIYYSKDGEDAARDFELAWKLLNDEEL